MKRALGICGTLWLGVCHAGADPIALLPETDQVSLAGRIEVLRDDSRQLTLDDVRAPARAGQWQRSEKDQFNFGFHGAAYWYRFAVRAPVESPWVLEVGFPVMDEVDVHFIHADGATQSVRTGDRRAAPPELLAHRAFAVPFSLEPDAAQTVHVRVQNAAAHIASLKVWSAWAFHDENALANLVRGGYFGGLFLMTLYSLIVYFWIRDRAYLYYVLYVTGMTAMSAIITGYARLYVGAASESAAIAVSDAYPYSIFFSGLFATLFMREFLAVHASRPRIDRLLLSFAAVYAGAFAATPALAYGTAVKTGFAVAAVTSTVGLCITIYLAAAGSRAARFYLVASGIFYVTIVLSAALMLAERGGPLTLTSWQIGIWLEAALLSLALADRVATERRERARLSRLKQFFAPQVAEAILEEGGQALLAPQRREVTVLFTDLRGFTAFAAHAEPEDVVRVLREYHEAVAAAAEKHHGNVEQFAGDSVMVFFNAPVELPGHERCAVHLAFELRETFRTLCEAWRKRGYELGVGMGLAGGFATVGAAGAKGRMAYSCTGTVTNLAARLCAQAQDGQVLIARTFLARIEGLVASEDLGERELKGIPKPVAVHNLTQLNLAGAAA